MATFSDLKEVREALDAGLVSQAEFDEVKRDYLRAKKEASEFQKKELRAKEEVLEANKDFQKKELRAKEEFQKRELRTKEDFQKRELIAKEEFQQKKSEADLRVYALESIVKHGSSIMSEEQKADLVRDYAKMSGLDGGAEQYARASKRQRALSLSEDRDAPPPQPPTPPAPAVAVIPPTDAPVKADEAEYSNYSDGNGEDDSDSDEPRTAKRTRGKKWTDEEDAALVAALRAGQRVTTIKIRGRSGKAAEGRFNNARARGLGSPALREYLEETCPEYVHKPPSERLTIHPWSAEEDQTFIQAHREGKTQMKIAGMLPGRSHDAVYSRWRDAKLGKAGTAALLAYAAECRKV